jgi:sugar transferase (PEP-CTERM system associated)
MRIFRHYVSAPAVAMLLVEVLLIGIILFAFVVSARPASVRPTDFGADARTAAGLAVAIALIMFSTGAYDKLSLSDYRHLLSRLVVCLVISLLSMLAVGYFDARSSVQILGQHETELILALFAVFPAIFITRVMYFAAIRGRAADRRILVIGAGASADRIERFVRSHLDFNAEILGYTAVASEGVAVPENKVIRSDESLAAVATRLKATEIVVAITERRGFPTAPLLECRLRGFVVTNFLNFWERETRQVMLDLLDPSWLIYSDGFQLSGALNAFLKRTFDVVVSLAILIVTSPILLLAALAVRLDSPGPIFYKQERVGRNGKAFNIFKLRTMREDAEQGGVPQWAGAKDPRVTRVGSLLRLTRIDEIPQVFNVLRGDMSFVGPRPERPFFVESLAREIPYYRERLRMRPGITGWAQINYPYGASIEDAKAKLSYDLYYIKNYSIFFDLLIAIGTVQVVLWNKGAR